MARHARWIRKPNDPRSILGWLFWTETPLAPAQRRTLWMLVPGLIALIVVLSVAFGPPGFGFAFCGALLAIVGYSRPGAREHAALPTLGEHDVFPVSLELRDRRNRRVGRERGWIAFVDGWLVYEGPRTAFALDTRSVEQAERWMWTLRIVLQDGDRVAFTLLSDFLQTDRPAKRRDLQRLDAALDGWHREPPSEGEAILPPRDELPATAAEGFVAPLSGVLTGLLAVLMGMVYHVPLFTLAGIGLTLGSIVLFLQVRRRLKRSLEAFEPLDGPAKSDALNARIPFPSAPAPSPPEGRGGSRLG